MERRRLPLREAILSAGVGLAAIAMIQIEPFVMQQQDYQEREAVLQAYPFTQQARQHFENVPFFDHHTTNNGGGYFHDFPFPYTEVFSNQPEAILHELSHEYYYSFLNNPQYNDSFMKSVLKTAEKDKEGGYFKTLVYGKDDWKGIPLQDVTEYYASISSYTMGGAIRPMPDVLQPYFAGEFQFNQWNAKK